MLPLPVQGSLHMLSETITAYDVAGGYVDRRWEDGAPSPDYTFSGSIQPSRDKELQLLPDGDVSDGAQTITTQTELFIQDTSQPTGQETLQTYIRHAGEIWRVMASVNWIGPGNFRKYVCTKYLEQT